MSKNPNEQSNEQRNEQNARTLAEIWVNPNDQRRNIPFAAGQSFTFRLTENPVEMWHKLHFVTQQNEVKEYMALVAEDGTEISATQILRRRNGLPINGNTTLEAAEDFINLFPESGVLTLTIAQVITRRFEDANGNVSNSNYIVWRPVTRQE